MNKKILWSMAPLALGMTLAGCGGNSETTDNAAGNAAGSATGNSATGAAPTNLSGAIKGDGSSTVFPITEAVAEEFGKTHPGVQVTVGVSGTGGGFKKFIAGDSVLQNASRPIKDKEDKSMQEKKREYIELPVAYDGLAIVVNPKNNWATSLTVAELKKIWEPGSKVNNWSQVRAGFPNKPLKLYGAGTDSGTFDYFTEAINGKEKASRADYTASEDDNTLVQGVSRDEGALGYFGLAYYEENASKLKIVKVDGGKGAVEPTQETVASNQYAPLSRPLFLYVERKAADKPEVAEFIKYYLTEGKALVKPVGYVPMPDNMYDAALARFEARTTGTVYKTDADKKTPLAKLYGAK